MINYLGIERKQSPDGTWLLLKEIKDGLMQINIRNEGDCYVFYVSHY